MIPDQLTQPQFDTVYNFLSLVIASQLFTALFLVVSQRRVLPRYRQALVMSAIVCGIAAFNLALDFDLNGSAETLPLVNISHCTPPLFLDLSTLPQNMQFSERDDLGGDARQASL